jgi:hypothetical protein
MTIEKRRCFAFAMTLLMASLAFQGCWLAPDKASLSDPQIQPLIKAMDQVDRASLGFTPVTTNAQISLELHSAGGTYDAMLHVYGATSRTIAFRKTSTGYRWISEQEIHEGPKWYQTVDGTFRENMVVEFQTERVNGIPTNQLTIRYTGNDTNLQGRELALTEAIPILEKWKTSPLEPQPPDLPGSGDEIGPLVVPLIFVFLVGCCLALMLGTLCCAIAAAVLAAGIISTSVLTGFLRKKVSTGFRALFIQLGAVAGMAGGAMATWVVTWFARPKWNSSSLWVIGITIGLLFGIVLAWSFNLLWSRVAEWLTKKLGNRN